MNNKQLTLGSLFDGIGGFPLAAVLSGVTPLWAAEIEPFCIAVAKERFPDMQHLGSVTDISGADIPPVDIITFGSPCQDLSVAGQRAGLDGARSGLFKEAIRIIYEMRNATNGKYPKYIVWENVPGAFSSNKGNDFKTVLEEITKTSIPIPSSGKWSNAGVVRSGGITAAWRLFDAQYWGVPQRRKRIYLIGSFGSDNAVEILFKRDSVRRYLATRGAEEKEIAARPRNSVDTANRVFDARGNGGGDISPTITGDHCSRINDYAPIVLKKVVGLDLYNNAVSGDTAVTITTATGQGAQNSGPSVACIYSAGFNGQNSATAAGVDYMEEKTPPIIKNKQTDVFCLQGSMIGRTDKNGPQGNDINKNVSFTVNTTDRHAVVYALDRASFNQGINAQYDFEITDSGINSTIVAKGPSAVAYKMLCCLRWVIRRLTPLECERLQGYPDFWTCLKRKEMLDGEEFGFWRNVMITDKKIKGKKCNEHPTPAQLTKWYNKLECDGSRYKALGNSLAIPCALRVIGYIADFERTTERNFENEQ